MKYNGSEFEEPEGFEEARMAAPLLDQFEPLNSSFYKKYIKRLMDIAVVLVSAPITVPVALVLVLLIRREGGSAFYRQDRIGKDGDAFVCWKLRSMVMDADEKLEVYLDQNPEAKAEWDEFQKLREDPRITPIGRFMRRSSLDELPQLWCVLKGDMSLVGPRPFLPQQQSLYTGQIYYQVRPGITGLWQVSAHNDTNFASRVFYDDRYARNISFWADLKIMFRTVFVMFRGSGL